MWEKMIVSNENTFCQFATIDPHVCEEVSWRRIQAWVPESNNESSSEDHNQVLHSEVGHSVGGTDNVTKCIGILLKRGCGFRGGSIAYGRIFMHRRPSVSSNIISNYIYSIYAQSLLKSFLTVCGKSWRTIPN